MTKGIRSVAGSLCFASLILLLCLGCGATPTRIVQSGSSIVPNSTAQDLVTYGDVAVVFTVVEELEVPPTEAEVARGEGTITRQVTARQEGKAVWSRPTRNKLAPEPGAVWTISDGGWVFHGTKRIPLEVEGRPRLVVGEQYLAVRTFSSLGGETTQEWFSLCYIPLRGGRINIDAKSVKDGSASYLRSLQDLSPAGVGRLLKSTSPDSEATPYMNLDAAHRYARTIG